METDKRISKYHALLGVSSHENNGSREQEVKSSTNKEPKTIRNQDIKSTRDQDNNKSTAQDIKASRFQNGKMERKNKKHQETKKSRVVETGGIVRRPENITLRVDFYRAIRRLAIDKGTQAWLLIDEALANYLKKEGVDVYHAK